MDSDDGKQAGGGGPGGDRSAKETMASHCLKQQTEHKPRLEMQAKRRRSASSGDAQMAAGPLSSQARPDGVTTLSQLVGHQEIFLRILGYLPATDLANVQAVNSYWARMSLDPQLWKRLYLAKYPHPHSSKLIYRPSADPRTPQRRPIKRLPSRAFPPPSPSPSRSPAPSAGQAGSDTASPQTRSGGLGRAVPLATRTEQPDEEIGTGIRNDGVDWKKMLSLGTNWSNGNVTSQASISLPPSPSPSTRSELPESDRPMRMARLPPYTEQHIALFPSFIITSGPDSPLLHVYGASSGGPSRPLGIIPPPPGWSSPSRPDNVTAVCADQAVSPAEEELTEDERDKAHLPARVAVFYESGGFVVLTVRSSAADPGRMSWQRESVHPPSHRPRSLKRRATSFAPAQDDPVVLATMYFPVLVTCTVGFHVSVYTLSPASASSTPSRPRHLSTLHSDTSFHPAALSLLPPEDGSSQDFRAGLTFCSPVYPSSWTVAVQDFSISLKATKDDPTPTGDVARGSCWHVGREDELEDKLVWPRRIKPVMGVKGDRALGIGTDGTWCVLAGGDNQIQVYSLPALSPSSSSTSSSSASNTSVPSSEDQHSITYSQTLLAHSTDVTSVSLAAGRCVSAGKDGRVLVWDLDEGNDDQYPQERIGRTVGFVEVKQGGRRKSRPWRGAAGPVPGEMDKLLSSDHDDADDDDDDDDDDTSGHIWPHPQSISAAARTLFLPRPPGDPAVDEVQDDRPAIRHLAFDEERIVGLVQEEKGKPDVMKIWSFNG